MECFRYLPRYKKPWLFYSKTVGLKIRQLRQYERARRVPISKSFLLIIKIGKKTTQEIQEVYII